MMTAGRNINVPVRALLLVLIIVAGEVVRALVSGSALPRLTDAGPIAMYAMLHAAVLGWVAARSVWPRVRLFGAIFLALYGVQAVLPYAELLYLGAALPFSLDGFASILVPAFPASALASGAAVLLFAGVNPGSDSVSAERSANVASWVWRVSAAGSVYAVLYFLAGMLIVHVHDYAREFYAGVGAEINPLTLFLFQIARGAVWALMAMPLLASQTTSTWERSNALGAAFAVFVGALLFAENPHLPAQMRMLHLIETSVSNFLFGLTAGYLLTRLIRR